MREPRYNAPVTLSTDESVSAFRAWQIWAYSYVAERDPVLAAKWGLGWAIATARAAAILRRFGLDKARRC